MIVRVLASLAVLGASPEPTSNTQEAVPVARAFLEAFVSNPQSTRKLVTEDALFIFIDMGGPYAEVLKGLGDKKPALAACNLDSLKQTGSPSATDLKDSPIKSLNGPGHLASIDGVYSCKRPDGRATFVDVNMILKDNLVVMFSLAPRRER